MMAAVVIFIGFVAVGHFVLEGIIGPSVRQVLRFRMFALRDELRDLRSATDGGLSDEVFDHLHDFLNVGIRLVSVFDFMKLVEARQKIKSDEGLQQEIDDRIAMVDECGHEGAQRIRESAMKTVGLALLMNSAGWFLWVVPVLATIAGAKVIWKWTRFVLSVPSSQQWTIVDLGSPSAIAC